LPVNCKFENAQNLEQNIPFVTDGCPRKFPEDRNSYFGKMARTGQGKYELPFRAFSFDYSKDSLLQISCEVLLCIEQNAGPCRKACWGPTTPPDPPQEDPGLPPNGDPRNGDGLYRRNSRPVLARVNFDLINGVAGNGDAKNVTLTKTLNVVASDPSSKQLNGDVNRIERSTKALVKTLVVQPETHIANANLDQLKVHGGRPFFSE